MALVVTFDESNGAGEDLTVGISDVAFGNADAADLLPVNNKITAANNSFGKYIKMVFTGMASEGLTEITTPKIWKSSGAYKTGEGVDYVGDDGGTAGLAYATPSESATGDSSIPIAEPGSRNLALNNSTTGVLTVDGKSDYMRFQRVTTGSTPAGALNSLTFSMSYVVS